MKVSHLKQEALTYSRIQMKDDFIARVGELMAYFCVVLLYVLQNHFKMVK